MELVKQKFFQTAALWHPTVQQSKDGKKSKMIVDFKTTLGTDATAVGMQVIKAIPAEYDTQLDQVEIVVSPF